MYCMVSHWPSASVTGHLGPSGMFSELVTDVTTVLLQVLQNLTLVSAGSRLYRWVVLINQYEHSHHFFKVFIYLLLLFFFAPCTLCAHLDFCQF